MLKKRSLIMMTLQTVPKVKITKRKTKRTSAKTTWSRQPKKTTELLMVLIRVKKIRRRMKRVRETW